MGKKWTRRKSLVPSVFRNSISWVKHAMESLSTTAMVVKGVGLPDALKKANENWKIDNKGKTFEETLKNLEKSLKAKLARKIDAPAKGGKAK